MSMIDIIIPTMWFSKTFISVLEGYCECPFINKIILIDNQKLKRPNSKVLKNPKIELVS